MRIRYKLSYVGRGLEKVQDPAWFMAGMEMRVQEFFPGA